MMGRPIPFNRPHLAGNELAYIAQAHANGHLSGDGAFTKHCEQWLEQHLVVHKALLTHSCTAALEMAVMLAGITTGDEVIMPSFTFVSTANAVVLRGGVPVFVDIRSDTMNIDETLIESAITSRTRAIVVVHYAGVGCDMDAVMRTANEHGLLVIEDAAQGVMSTYKGRPLGSIGQLAAISFHETKNVISGEGGALLINDRRFVERAEIIREKGTDRSRFYRGVVDKYTWVDVGSSYLPSELVAAFLAAQLEHADTITRARLDLWNVYHAALAPLEAADKLRRPVIPLDCNQNAHMYYVLLGSTEERTRVMTALKRDGVHSVFHYVPLHSSPAGRKFARTKGTLVNTDAAAARLLRLPMWLELESDQQRVIDSLVSSLGPCTILSKT
jgi:dTDP-4-amino-4,6-dideoxygalactose transaminase